MTHEQQPLPGEPAKAEQPVQPDRAEQLEYAHPKIWVGSLADYNNGDLHGSWMDAARPAPEIYTDIEQILASGDAARRGEAPEEWGIFDYDGFGGLRIGEYEQIEVVGRIAEAIARNGPAFAAFAAISDDPLAEVTEESFAEAYVGRFDSLSAYARELAEDLGFEGALDELPDSVRSYVRLDYEQFARDLELGGVVVSADGGGDGVFIFRN